MRIFWAPAPNEGGAFWVIDILGRGMRFFTDEVDLRCPTCGQERPGKLRRTRFRWLSLDVGCKPTRFFPRMFYLPPDLKPLGDRPEPRVGAFLERAAKLLRRKDGVLFIWWRIEDVGSGVKQGLGDDRVPVPPGRYLLLSPYWSPAAGGLEWATSTPPGPKYPKQV